MTCVQWGGCFYFTDSSFFLFLTWLFNSHRLLFLLHHPQRWSDTTHSFSLFHWLSTSCDKNRAEVHVKTSTPAPGQCDGLLWASCQELSSWSQGGSALHRIGILSLNLDYRVLLICFDSMIIPEIFSTSLPWISSNGTQMSASRVQQNDRLYK